MKKLLYILTLAVVWACTDNFEAINTDQKNPATVTGESLFNNATERYHHILNNADVNTNVFRLYAQYWAQTTYPEESQYQQIQRKIPDNWFERCYRDALKDLSEAERIIGSEAANALTAPVKKNKLAIIHITQVQIFANLVDLFGNIPYSEALDFGNPNPKYDDAKTVYYELIAQLDQAIVDMDVDAAGFDANSDLVHQGNMNMWWKTAHSLKLRMAMRLADTDPAKAKAMAEEAVRAGVFSSVAENLSVEYTSNAPYTYPAYEDLVLSGRSDYIAANTIVDKMNALNDPRRPYYFQENLGAGVFKGGIYGSGNAFSSFSSPGKFMYTANSPGISFCYSEVLFLMAEAAARGMDVGGTAAQYYEQGVTASILEWGGTTEDALAYLSQPEVAYATASGNWKQKIGIQKWLALYNNGLEGWTTWRLLDFELFNIPAGLTRADIPLRVVYPVNEATLNGANMNAAASAMGGDKVQTPIFWDMQ
ncbi:SusD/RagB-like outer membrane lipoprotein [Dyadobacter jejuensis]|uniref:SusD/RagB-like outer membrane lipoprotein n=1 Tax=Dyadobacter jejuensis TaxID=1082580 RepID=A0A316AR96_9BACT|nr:SusD/RagB family nutrient-binding outer membrane lipoprotein [Dyadobacter jejuensis]PWJ60245.1 SusD/RagB-like outer membrane lipoprotein [Dyadobacter jejuensis]